MKSTQPDSSSTDDNLVVRLANDANALYPDIRQWMARRRTLLIVLALGITVSIGSTGLLMGALTTALASYLMSRGMEMVPAMNVGFFTVGTLSLVLGIITTAVSVRKVRK